MNFCMSILRIILILLTVLIMAQPSRVLADGEVKMSLDEGHRVLIVPAVAAQRLNLSFGGTSAIPGQEDASGIELSARLISSSNRTRTFLVGLDLRELFAQVDGLSGVNLLNTKLGIRLEWRPVIKFAPSIGGVWFFGDTVVARDRDEQFNGLSGSVFVAIQAGSARCFLESAIGNYNQGGGFILLNHTPGTDSINIRSISLGVEFPIETIWPEWLKMTPPTSPVLP